MWVLFAGYLISFILEYFVVKLYKNNFLNKNISIFGVVTGWFFQEHVRNHFNLTSGKVFMVNQDFRSKFFINLLKIIKNIVFWGYFSLTYKLVTIILLNFLLIYAFVYFLKYNFYTLIKTKKNKIRFHYKEFQIYVILYFMINNNLYNLLFIIKPFILFCTFIYFLITIFLLCHLFFIFISSNFKNLGLILSLFNFKLNYYFFLVCFYLNLTANFINLESFINENFFQELFLKGWFFYFYF